jgi:hypothetical protein
MNGIISDIVSLLINHYQVLLILPIIMALKAEKHYVARTSILANTVGMFVAVAPYWDVTWSWLNIRGFPLFHAYVLIGLVFGLIAFLSYMLEVRQEAEFYTITWLLYNSAIATFVCLVAAISL